MQPRRIVHPTVSLSALAIPLDYGGERYVVLALVGNDAFEQCESFFETLENLSVPRAQSDENPPAVVPLAPTDPRIVTFGFCASLEWVLGGILGRRGWTMRAVPHLSELRKTIQAASPDLIFVDLTHLPDPYRSVLRMHGMLDEETTLVGWSDTPENGDLVRQGLVDCCIEHDASESVMFDLLKRCVRGVDATRKTRLRRVTDRAEADLLTATTAHELCVAGARCAAEVMHGWAAVHLVNASGDVFAAERPALAEPVLAAIPKAFLSDTPLYQFRADERFFEEMSDDRRVREALVRMGAVSAASIPLQCGERRLGALATVSHDAEVDSCAFEALDGFARTMTRRFEQLAINVPLYERNGVWQCIRHGLLELAVYRSRSSSVTWDYHKVGPALGVLSIGTQLDSGALNRMAAFGSEAVMPFLERDMGERSAFVAACNPIARTLAFAARGFSPPVFFDSRGPVGALTAKGDTICGKTSIRSSGLLIADAQLRRWFEREGVVTESITELLEDLQPPGLAVVVTGPLPAN